MGGYAIQQGTVTAGANYTLTYEAGTLTIDPAALTVTADDKSKTYGLDDPALTFTQIGLVGEDLITGALARVAGENVGSYAIEQGNLNAGANYSITFNPGTLTIDPASLTVTVSAEDKVYDSFMHATVSFADNRVSGDILSYSYSSALFSDDNAGYGKDVNVLGITAYGADAGNYYLTNSSASTTANITPKEVSVSLEEPFLYIREGDDLPEFAINYHMGLIAGDVANETYTVLRDTDGALYDPTSSVSAGTYTVTPAAYNSNYSFSVETGILHVNPFGPGTRAVKPVLNCIERIRNDYYVANFEYRNDNDVAVYIPWGEDNMLIGSGIDTSIPSTQPTWFASGGGSFQVFFDGSELSWTVNSRDGDQKVSNAASANSSSTKCTPNNRKSASVIMEVEAEPGLDADNVLAYPNPVTDKLYISMKDIQNYKMIILYDFAGRSHPLTSIEKGPDQLELEMGHLASGHYFIRIEMEDTMKVVPVIKQ